MEDVVRQQKTNLACEEIIARAVQYFSKEDWRLTSQSPCTATLQGKPPLPRFMLPLTVLGLLLFIVPGVILYVMVIRKMVGLHHLVVTAIPVSGGTVVMVQHPQTTERLVAGFLEGLPGISDGGADAEETGFTSNQSDEPGFIRSPLGTSQTGFEAESETPQAPARSVLAATVAAMAAAAGGYWLCAVPIKAEMPIPEIVVTAPVASSSRSVTDPFPLQTSQDLPVPVSPDTTASEPVVEPPAIPPTRPNVEVPRKKSRKADRRGEAVPTRKTASPRPPVPPPAEHRQVIPTRQSFVPPTARGNNRVDDIYNKRAKAKCARGLMGLVCREMIRFELCDGKWTADEIPGMTRCRVIRQSVN